MLLAADGGINANMIKLRFWGLSLSGKLLFVHNGNKLLVRLRGINSSELCWASSLDGVVS